MLLAYIDCFAGLSGATFLEALVGVGLSREQVDQALDGLPGVYGKRDGQVAAPILCEFRKAITGSNLPVLVKQTVGAVIRRLEDAEKAVHKEVMLLGLQRSEWGGWQTNELRAAAGVVLGLSMLGIVRVECSPLRVGGWVTSGVGKQPEGRTLTFSPITAEVLCGSPVHVYGTDEIGEYVTPVGAALVSTLASKFGPLPPMTIRGIGYGKEETRQTRVFIGERVCVEAKPFVPAKEAMVPIGIKSESVYGLEELAANANVTETPAQESSAPVPANVTNGIGAPDSLSHIVGFEEWVALSIKGHQQSGRQRV